MPWATDKKQRKGGRLKGCNSKEGKEEGREEEESGEGGIEMKRSIKRIFKGVEGQR